MNNVPDQVPHDNQSQPLRKVLKIGSAQFDIETGKIAKQAGGAVIVRQNDSVVLVTATAETEEREGIDFLPLTVEYRERAAAGGFIPGSFTRREAKPADHEILTARLIDRSIRPLFAKDYKVETQVIATILSADPSADPAIMSLLGASAALLISDIPWAGPIIGVRTCLVDGQYVLYPTLQDLNQAHLNLVVSLGKNGLVMVEGSAREATEKELVDALLMSQEAVSQALQELEEWSQKVGKKKVPIPENRADTELITLIRQRCEQPIRDTFGTELAKSERKAFHQKLEQDIVEQLAPDYPERKKEILSYFEIISHDLLRSLTLNSNKRLDGRDFAEIRPIHCEVGWLPRSHGSTIFTRGETQALVSCSLGTSRDEQLVETLYGLEKKRFILHYNFPPYSVGEVRPIRGPGRREIGHGALAARALEAIIPDYDSFPYTIRVVSDIAESNGSSSMATVCGGCLALLDAGVPLRNPVAGIAMGLIKDNERLIILSDILGDEDHFGDMDFKVAGTERGITAVQMDNKLGSLERVVLEKALQQAHEGRLHILKAMKHILRQERPELSPRAPRVITVKINQNKIRDLIGPGGKTIQEIQQQTGSKIEIDDAGRVNIYADDLQSAQKALSLVKNQTAEVEVGKVYQGTVMAVKNFGVFVRIFSKTEGLVHISELDETAVTNINEYARVGDEMMVRVLGVDTEGE